MTPNGKRSVWLAMFMSNVMMLIALTTIPRAAPGNPVLGKALLVIGMALVPLAVMLPRLVKVPHVWTVALAVCESAAVCGILAQGMAGLAQAWMLPLMGLMGMGLLFPFNEDPK